MKINYGDEQFSYPVVGKFKPISLLNFIGLNSKDYSELPAMQPDVCISCANKKSLNIIEKDQPITWEDI